MLRPCQLPTWRVEMHCRTLFRAQNGTDSRSPLPDYHRRLRNPENDERDVNSPRHRRWDGCCICPSIDAGFRSCTYSEGSSHRRRHSDRFQPLYAAVQRAQSGRTSNAPARTPISGWQMRGLCRGSAHDVLPPDESAAEAAQRECAPREMCRAVGDRRMPFALAVSSITESGQPVRSEH